MAIVRGTLAGFDSAWSTLLQAHRWSLAPRMQPQQIFIPPPIAPAAPPNVFATSSSFIVGTPPAHRGTRQILASGGDTFERPKRGALASAIDTLPADLKRIVGKKLSAVENVSHHPSIAASVVRRWVERKSAFSFAEDDVESALNLAMRYCSLARMIPRQSNALYRELAALVCQADSVNLFLGSFAVHAFTILVATQRLDPSDRRTVAIIDDAFAALLNPSITLDMHDIDPERSELIRSRTITMIDALSLQTPEAVSNAALSLMESLTEGMLFYDSTVTDRGLDPAIGSHLGELYQQLSLYVVAGDARAYREAELLRDPDLMGADRAAQIADAGSAPARIGPTRAADRGREAFARLAYAAIIRAFAGDERTQTEARMLLLQGATLEGASSYASTVAESLRLLATRFPMIVALEALMLANDERSSLAAFSGAGAEEQPTDEELIERGAAEARRYSFYVSWLMDRGPGVIEEAESVATMLASVGLAQAHFAAQALPTLAKKMSESSTQMQGIVQKAFNVMYDDSVGHGVQVGALFLRGVVPLMSATNPLVGRALCVLRETTLERGILPELYQDVLSDILPQLTQATLETEIDRLIAIAGNDHMDLSIREAADEALLLIESHLP